MKDRKTLIIIIVMLVVFLPASILGIINHKNRKKVEEPKEEYKDPGYVDPGIVNSNLQN